MNMMILIGNLVRDPEYKDAGNGEMVCSFTVAENRRARDGRELVNYIRVSAWGKLGEICASYLSKGRKVMVSGRASARGWIGRDGGARAGIEMTAEKMELLTAKPVAEAADAEDAAGAADDFTEVDDAELPF